MHKSRTIKVKPDVLKSLRFYSRQRTVMVLEHFSKKTKLKFGVNENFLKEIEATEHELKLGLVKEFARLYKFPLSCFLLPRPIKDDLVPPDYRRVSSNRRGVVSPKMALILRSAQRAQFVIATLVERTSSGLPKARLGDDTEKVAQKIRNLLSNAFTIQKRSNNPYEFFVSLRKGIEKLDVVVLKRSFPLNDARAFSLTNQKPFVIVINNKDGSDFGYTPKLFSLLHEFGHILLRDGGLCNDYFSRTAYEQELFCNSFAAACLMPKARVEQFLDDTNIGSLSTRKQIKWVDRLRSEFLAGGEVIIRRLHSLGYITWDDKDSLIEEWNKFAVRYRKKGFIPHLSESQKCVGRNGTRFTQVVFDGVSKGLITPENATSYLGIKLKHFADLREIVGSL